MILYIATLTSPFLLKPLALEFFLLLSSPFSAIETAGFEYILERIMINASAIVNNETPQTSVLTNISSYILGLTIFGAILGITGSQEVVWVFIGLLSLGIYIAVLHAV